MAPTAYIEREADGRSDEVEVLLLHGGRQEVEQAVHQLRVVVHGDHAVA